MKRSWIQNLLLLFFSLILALLLGEYLLRFFLFGQNYPIKLTQKAASYAIFPSDSSENFYNEDYWKLNFLFNQNAQIERPHPLLGWTGHFNGQNYIHYNEEKKEGLRPVLFFGDSFAMCVDSADCFEDYLNNDSVFNKNYYFLNYGVGGYGLDQIQLLMKEVVPKYENPIVIFSLLTTDLDRSMLKFRDAQKPFFEIEDDALVLKGTPIVQSTSDYVDKNPPEIHSYFLNRAFNVLSRNLDINIPDRYAYRNKIKELNSLILRESFDYLKKSNVDFFILLFHPETFQVDNWRMKFIENQCQNNSVPYLTDYSVKNEDKIKNDHKKADYYILGDGHPSSLANKVVAQKIKDWVQNVGLISDAYRYQKLKKSNVYLRKIDFEMARITRDDQLLEAIRVKAKKQNIPIDSMLLIDAKFILSNLDVN